MSLAQLDLYYAIVNEFEQYRSLSQPEKLKLIQDVIDKPYLDLLCDWAFKHVFGNNLDLLQMLLRDILQMDLTVQESLPNEIDKFRPDDKEIIMDVICRLRDGRRIIAEMQHTDCPTGKIVYTYELREQETGELYGEYISLNFCELPRLAAQGFEGLGPKEEWFQLLKNMRNFALNPKGIPERMKRVLEVARSSALVGKEQLQYFRAMISEIEKEDIATANYKDGFDEGLEKGLAQGREQQNLENARRMLADHMAAETIAKYTKLTVEQIRALEADASR